MRKERLSADGRVLIQDYRKQAVAKLGYKCEWPGCEVTDLDMLQIDHIGGGGNKEAKSIGSYGIHKKILGMPDPHQEYQLLCANHNTKKYLSQDLDYREPEEEPPDYTDYEELERTLDN